jgi:predicted HNH restriction endonuclease
MCSADLTGSQTKFCSKGCTVKGQSNANYANQQERARQRKRSLIAAKGGKCQNCGYKKSMVALQFHHLDPTKKDLRLDSRRLSNSSLDRILIEAEKCILLCANCHAEEHHGIVT